MEQVKNGSVHLFSQVRVSRSHGLLRKKKLRSFKQACFEGVFDDFLGGLVSFYDRSKYLQSDVYSSFVGNL